MSSFSEKLGSLRENKGWTKTMVAKHLGIPVPTYSNYEYGNREPDIKTINLIANMYGVSVDYLLGNETSSNGKQSVSETDLDEMLDNAHSYDGKPLDDHDRELIRQYLRALLNK